MMTSKEYYNDLVARYRAYNWSVPLPYDRWVILWWPTISKTLKD